MSAGSPLHRMMSQGINSVLAKTLINIESDYRERLDSAERKWNEKLGLVVDRYEEKILCQNKEINSLKDEVRGLKEMICPSKVCIAAPGVSKEFFYSKANSALKETVESLSYKILLQEKATSAIQDNIDDFIQLYENRNNAMELVLAHHENKLCLIHHAISTISKQYTCLSTDLITIQKDVKEKHSSIDDKDETRIPGGNKDQLLDNLESRIVECNMKYDQLKLTVQQHNEEYQRKLEEYEIVKAVTANRAKQRREKVLQDVQTKQRSILKQILKKEGESKLTIDPTDALDIGEIKQEVQSSSSTRKVRFNVVDCHDDPVCDIRDIETKPSPPKFFDENNMHLELDDNDSEFSAGISLVLLDELTIV